MFKTFSEYCYELFWQLVRCAREVLADSCTFTALNK